MGVAQLTLSCDRLFITNLCFIRLFPISSIWRADRRAGPGMRGFPFLTRMACAESNARKRSIPTEIIHPTKKSAVPAGNRDSRSSRANRRRASTSSINIKAGCAPSGSVQILITAAEFTPAQPRSAARTERLRVTGFRCMVSARAVQIAGNSADWNLPLAARARVGHIGPTGAVAEWLKAAVC
jgi:hypothetical protein